MYSFLKNSFEDPKRDVKLGHNDRLIKPKPPEVGFDMTISSWSEIKSVVSAARSAWSPGPSGVPYSVYKRCPGLKLWRGMKLIWRRGKVEDQWWYAEGVWIPKEENSRDIEQFRCIYLLSTESKIFLVSSPDDFINYCYFRFYKLLLDFINYCLTFFTKFYRGVLVV